MAALRGSIRGPLSPQRLCSLPEKTGSPPPHQKSGSTPSPTERGSIGREARLGAAQGLTKADAERGEGSARGQGGSEQGARGFETQRAGSEESRERKQAVAGERRERPQSSGSAPRGAGNRVEEGDIAASLPLEVSQGQDKIQVKSAMVRRERQRSASGQNAIPSAKKVGRKRDPKMARGEKAQNGAQFGAGLA